jgi:excisionase family DNA binding protein
MPPDPAEITSRLSALESRLDQLLELARRPPPEPRFLGVEEAASYASLSAESIRRMLAAGQLTPYRPRRGRVLVDRRELEAVVLASTGRVKGGRGARRTRREV